jgi:hypothetical protein
MAIKKSELIVIRVTADMKQRFEVAAASSSASLTTFMVRAAEAAAVVATKRQARSRAVARPTHRKSSGACPTFFKALCWETRRGGGLGYDWAGRKLTRVAAELVAYETDDDWTEKLEGLEALVLARDDAGVLGWFDRELPRCMSLIPRRRRASFLAGVYEEVEADDTVLRP